MAHLDSSGIERALEEIAKGARLEGRNVTLSAALLDRILQAAPRNQFSTQPLLKGARLAGANLAGANLAGVVLDEANLSGARMSGAHLENSFLANASMIGVDLGNAHLDHAYLAGAKLGRATLSDASLVDTKLDSANLARAGLDRANLAGATLTVATLTDAGLVGANLDRVDLRYADLEGADMSEANLEGADLREANLAGAKLSHARLDYRTSLEKARLFTVFVKPQGWKTRDPSTLLSDVRWNGVQVTGVEDWNAAVRLGEDPYPKWPRFSRLSKGLVDWSERAIIRPDLVTAVRAYRQIATLLESQGMKSEARRFDYRASQLARRAAPRLPSWMPSWGWLRSLISIPGRFASWLLDIGTAYGYSPWRILIAYIVTVSVFAVIYASLGFVPWNNAFWFSLIAFHGRGVITGGHIDASNALLPVPAIEAVLGLLIEALFVAVLIRRLFRD